MRILSLAVIGLFVLSASACQSDRAEGETEVEVAPQDAGELAEEILGRWRVMEESGRQHSEEYFVRFDRDGIYRVERAGAIVDSMAFSLAGEFVTLYAIAQDFVDAPEAVDPPQDASDPEEEATTQMLPEAPDMMTVAAEVFRIEVETNGITLRDENEEGRYLVLRRPDFGQIRDR